MGQKLMSYVAELRGARRQDDPHDPEGAVRARLQTLAKPGANVPFMMPKRVAETDPQQADHRIHRLRPLHLQGRTNGGPGEKVVYLKNPKYKPRSEPASGLAGGKVAKVDRVEWIWIADAQTQVNALLNGEIDLVEAPPHDLLPLLAADKNIELFVWNPAGRQYAFRFNVLHKPFDNPKMRHAVAYALNQKDMLDAVIGDPEWFRRVQVAVPLRLAAASRPKASTTSSTPTSPRRARCCRRPATTARRSCSCSRPTSSRSANLAPVTKSLLEKAGFKVDVQAMDWQTLVTRRTKKDPPTAGGWHAFLTSWASVDILDPVAASFLNAALRQGDVRLALRRRDGKAARRVLQGDRSGASRRRSPRPCSCARSNTRPTSSSGSTFSRVPSARA